MNPFVSNGNKLRWKFENVKDLDENRMFSDTFKIGQTEWKIGIQIGMVNDLEYLGVLLCTRDKNENEKQWICQTYKKVTMINQYEPGNDESIKDISCYSNTALNWGWIRFYFWDDVIDDGFLKNDSIIIEIDLSIKLYDFSKNIPNLTDITLKVEDTEFYTSKAILCTHSEYFYDLFINKNHEESVIEFSDVNIFDFRYFLASFYPFFDGVQEENYERIIELAEKFKIPTLHKSCENYLIRADKLSVEKKLEYAEKYDYYDLMEQCIESLDNAKQIKYIQNSDEFYKFKESTKLMIMKKILDFC